MLYMDNSPKWRNIVDATVYNFLSLLLRGGIDGVNRVWINSNGYVADDKHMSLLQDHPSNKNLTEPQPWCTLPSEAIRRKVPDLCL